MVNTAQELLYNSLKAELNEKGAEPEGMANITRYDIYYHLRRAFFILYRIYNSLEKAKGDIEKIQTAMSAVSLTVKLLKLIHDMLSMLRDKAVPHLIKLGPGYTSGHSGYL